MSQQKQNRKPQQTQKTAMTPEERKADRERRQQKKLEVAQQPGSHVFQAPAGPEMEAWLQISRQFNDLYPKFKLQTGAFGSISAAKAERIISGMETLCLNAAFICEEVSKAIPGNHFDFRVPRAMAPAYARFKAERKAEIEKQQGETQTKPAKTAAVPAAKKTEPKQEKPAATPAEDQPAAPGKLAVVPAEKPAVAATAASA